MTYMTRLMQIFAAFLAALAALSAEMAETPSDPALVPETIYARNGCVIAAQNENDWVIVDDVCGMWFYDEPWAPQAGQPVVLIMTDAGTPEYDDDRLLRVLRVAEIDRVEPDMLHFAGEARG